MQIFMLLQNNSAQEGLTHWPLGGFDETLDE